MKNFKFLTLSMLLLIAGITIQANIHSDNFDERNHLNKHRNSNRYDGTTITTADEHDMYDTNHHVNKHRESHKGTHCHHGKKNHANKIEKENRHNHDQHEHSHEDIMIHENKPAHATIPAQTTRTWAEYFRSLY